VTLVWKDPEGTIELCQLERDDLNNNFKPIEPPIEGGILMF